ALLPTVTLFPYTTLFRSSAKLIPHALLVSQSEAGRAWLSRLGEVESRDKILAHLFGRMKKEGLIEAFQNIHGRYDKGIDYLIAEDRKSTRLNSSHVAISY